MRAVLLCVYVNHTHPVCWASCLGTNALRLTPCLALTLSPSLQKPSVLRWKSHIASANSTWAFTEFLKIQRKRPWVGHPKLVFSTYHSSPAPRCIWNKVMACYDGTKTLSFHWIRPQKVKACVPGWRTVNTQTCSKCASPQERREQNGIKLDQGRVYFSKRKQDRGLKYRLQL